MRAAYSISKRLAQGSQLDFFDDGQPLQVGDDFSIEYPDNSRGSGKIVTIEPSGKITVKVGEAEWQIRRATAKDNPIETPSTIAYVIE